VSFAQTFGADYLTLNPDIVWGTAMLGRQFGTIKTASIKRTGEREQIVNDAGELVLLLLKNPGYEVILSAAFDRNVSPPGLLEQVTLPLIGLTGWVMEGANIAWEGGSERIINIPVSTWDCMSGAKAYRLTPLGARVEIGKAGNPPEDAPALSALAVTSNSVTLGIGFVAGAERYQVQWSEDGLNWTTFGSTQVNYIEQEGLRPRQTRKYRARGMDGEAGGPWSEILTVTTQPASAAPASAPTLTITSLASAFRVNWQAVNDAEDYEVQWRKESFDPWTALTITSGLSAILTGVIYNEARQFRVRARNSIGQSAWVQINVALYAIPALTITPISRDTLYYRFIGNLPFYGAIRARWSLTSDMANAVELPYNLFDLTTGYNYPLEGIPQGTRTYWQAKQTNNVNHSTEWGPVTTMLSLPRTPTKLQWNGLDGPVILAWTNPGGEIDGWRIYTQNGTGPLTLYSHSDYGPLIPLAVTSLDYIAPAIPVGRKIFVTAVRGTIESPLSNQVTRT